MGRTEESDATARISVLDYSSERPAWSLVGTHNDAMDMTPIIIIASAVVLVALITIALRRTIKHDRAAIKGDMANPQDVEQYKKNYGGKG